LKAISWENVKFKPKVKSKTPPPAQRKQHSSLFVYNYVPPYDFKEGEMFLDGDKVIGLDYLQK
jgi:hypothetical protein